MTNPSRFWADWTTREFTAAQADGSLAQTVAVLPVAAVEQHGPHLPLRVDAAIVDGIIAACLPHLGEQTRVLFLPTQSVGLSPEHTAFAGTLSLRSHTLLQLWTDIAESVAASGVKKLVFLNSHGGQAGAMDMVGRDLRARLGLSVYGVNWYQLPLLDANGADLNDLFSAHEHRFGIHAGAIETSLMLALHPELVQMQYAQNFASASEERAQQFSILGNGKSAKWAWQMQDYNAQGAVGDAASASAEKGHALLDAAGRALAQLLREVQQA